MKKLLIPVAVGSICFMAILLVQRRPRAADALASLPEKEELLELRRVNAELRAQLASCSNSHREAPKQQLTTEQASHLDRLETLRDWVAARRVHLVVQLLGPEGKLSAEFVELFRLTPGDRLQLEKATDSARRDLLALGVSRASVSINPDGSYSIRVPSFIEEGRGIYHRSPTRSSDRSVARNAFCFQS